MHHGDNLRDNGDVLPRVQWNDNAWNHDLEYRRFLTGETAAIGIACRFPILQLHYHLDPFLLPDRPDSEQRRYIDEAYATDFHVMRRKLMTPADEDIVTSSRHLHHIISHQPVPPLDQIQHTLAFPDPGPPDEEEADTVDVRERAMQRGARRKCLFHNRLDTAIKLSSLELAPEDGNPSCSGELEQLSRNFLALRHEDARQVEAEESCQGLVTLIRRQCVEVRDLGLAEHMKSVGCKTPDISGQGQAGAGHLRFRDLAIQAELPCERFELKRITSPSDEVAESK